MHILTTVSYTHLDVYKRQPGTITNLNVKNGKNIKRGEILCILEAMKMENEIIAPADGTILKTEVQQGSAVQTDDILVVIG